MRKFISGFIVGAMITTSFTVFASSYNIVTNPFNVVVNGEDKGQIGYLINDSTYLPLKQTGELLGVNVSFQDNTIYVGEMPGDYNTKTPTTHNGAPAIAYHDCIFINANYIESVYGYAYDRFELGYWYFTNGSDTLKVYKNEEGCDLGYKDDSSDSIWTNHGLTTYINIKYFE